MSGELAADILTTLKRFGLESYARFYSLYRGKVVSNVDALQQGRIRVQVPILGGGEQLLPDFAYPVTPYAGKNFGAFFPPEIGDMVYVMFEGGDPRAPLYLGGWWMNPGPEDPTGVPAAGKTYMPSDFRGATSPTIRGIVTKEGHKILFKESPGADSGVFIETAGGGKVNLSDQAHTLTIEMNGAKIVIDQSGAIRLGAGNASEPFVLGYQFAQMFLAHTHQGVQAGGSTSGPPTPNQVPLSTKVFGV